MREGWGQDWVGGIPHGLESYGGEGWTGQEASCKVLQQLRISTHSLFSAGLGPAYEAMTAPSCLPIKLQ